MNLNEHVWSCVAASLSSNSFAFSKNLRSYVSPLMESEQEFLYQFFVRNVLPLNELNSKCKTFWKKHIKPIDIVGIGVYNSYHQQKKERENMKNLKKTLALTLAFTLAVGATACGSSKD